jgi:hypothetical protein
MTEERREVDNTEFIICEKCGNKMPLIKPVGYKHKSTAWYYECNFCDYVLGD